MSGRPGRDWVYDAFHALCDETSPAWAAAYNEAEYWDKVMQTEPPIYAVGRDFGRFLPGLFWLNFFGRRCSAAIGRERLESLRAPHVVELDDGVAVMLAQDPQAWNTPEYAAVEADVKRHLGEDLFFSKTRPQLETLVPDWRS